MSERVFRNEAEQAAWELIALEANQLDRDLASLLMCVAFNGDATAEARNGLRPLYLIQAYYIRRYFRDDLREKLDA